jgi:hypothetical protein
VLTWRAQAHAAFDGHTQSTTSSPKADDSGHGPTRHLIGSRASIQISQSQMHIMSSAHLSFDLPRSRSLAG